MEFQNFITEERRLNILKILSVSPAYTANESVIKINLSSIGIKASTDQVKNDLLWLHEQQLAYVNNAGGILVAQITKRGDEVGSGIIAVHGVSKPVPR